LEEQETPATQEILATQATQETLVSLVLAPLVDKGEPQDK
jgi:hypothetical protein